jgi:parvulin-like peptidyl-prolyl isomerase
MLQSEAALFSHAPKHGERFPYGVNYVERTRDYVKSQFGEDMANALFSLDPADGVWRGPFLSPYGTHLVMVVKRKDARHPPLDEVRDRVAADLNSERKKAQSEKVIKAIVDTYKIEVDLRDGDGKDVAGLGQRN